MPLQYLHASPFISCELKPSNILLDENSRIKLDGIGFSLKLAALNKNLLTQTLVSLLTGRAFQVLAKCMLRLLENANLDAHQWLKQLYP